jgi:hypothetical protein
MINAGSSCTKDAMQDIDTAVSKADRLVPCPHGLDRLRALVLNRPVDPLSGKTDKKKLLASPLLLANTTQWVNRVVLAR